MIIRRIPISHFCLQEKNSLHLAFLDENVKIQRSEDVWFIIFGINYLSCQCPEITLYQEQELMI